MDGSWCNDEVFKFISESVVSSWSKSAVRGGIGGGSLLIETVSRVVANAWCWLSVAVALSPSSTVTAVLPVLALSAEVLLSSATGMNMSNVRGGSGGPTSR